MQAAIAAVHDQAARAEDTDWREILGLYGLPERMTGNPMLSLNRAIAAAMVDGPAAAHSWGRSTSRSPAAVACTRRGSTSGTELCPVAACIVAEQR